MYVRPFARRSQQHVSVCAWQPRCTHAHARPGARVRARVPAGEVASSNRAKAPQGLGAPRPSGGGRANQRKCRSCVGFTDHDSGICRRCRDAAGRGAQPKSVAPVARKGAVGVDGK